MINRQRSSDFTSKIHNIFGLEEQGGALVALVTKAIACKHACLLFLDVDGEEFTTLFCKPETEGNPLYSLRLSRQSPIVEYLRQHQKLLTRESLTNAPGFRGLSEQEAVEIKLDKIKLFIPLISRD